MGISEDYGLAFAKAQEAAGNKLPTGGFAFVSVRDEDKDAIIKISQRLVGLGFHLVATRGTAAHLRQHGVVAEVVNKVAEGSPHIADRIKAGGISFVINTTQGRKSIADSHSVRRATLVAGVAYTTTIEGARAALDAMESTARRPATVKTLQEYNAR
jgi:carbamoyl-phosphate synthase large subunit